MVDEKETQETINLAEFNTTQTQLVQTEIEKEQRLAINDACLIQTDSLDNQIDDYKLNPKLYDLNSIGKFLNFYNCFI
jgi:hypothetical protein